MSDVNKTERRLKNSGGETPDLRSVIGERDPEEVDVFGFQLIYTTGEFTLPRDALLEKMSEVGLPEWMAPSAVAPHRAFGRMISDLAEDGEEVEFDGHKVRFDVDSGDSRYSQHFHAKVWHEADEESENAGRWVDHELGVISYNSDTKGLSFIDRVDQSHALAPLWYNGLKSRAIDRFERHQELHNGKDVNNMTYYLCRNWTDSVKLRDSCYFVPASHTYKRPFTESIGIMSSGGDPEEIAKQEIHSRSDIPDRAEVESIHDGGDIAVVSWTGNAGIDELIDGFRELYRWIDEEFKTRGQTTELFAIEIVDSERQREMVERKVRAEMEDSVGDLFDDVVEEVREGASADAIAERVVDDLDGIEGAAQRHSATLQTELSVKRAMSEVLAGMDDEREEVMEAVLDEAGLAGETAEA